MSKPLIANLSPAADHSNQMTATTFKWATVGSIVGAFGIGITSCCIVPLVLLSLGLSGAWMGSFALLAPFKPLFIVLTAALLGYAHYLVYFAPRKVCEGGVCPPPRPERSTRVVLWAVTALAVAGVGIGYAEPYLLTYFR
jgi:mercuric ion transport protein